MLFLKKVVIKISEMNNNNYLIIYNNYLIIINIIISYLLFFFIFNVQFFFLYIISLSPFLNFLQPCYLPLSLLKNKYSE